MGPEPGREPEEELGIHAVVTHVLGLLDRGYLGGSSPNLRGP